MSDRETITNEHVEESGTELASMQDTQANSPPTPDTQANDTNGAPTQDTPNANKSTKSNTNTCCMRCTKVSIFTLICIMIGLIMVGQTTIEITLFVLNENQCDNNTEYEHNLHENFQATQESYYRFSQILYCSLSFLHWFEYGYLFYGIFCFLHVQATKKYPYGVKPMLCPTESPRVWDSDKEPKPCATPKKFLKTKIQPVFVLLFFAFFLGCSITSPIINLKDLVQTLAHNRKCHFTHIIINFANEILTILARIVTVLVRIIFVFAAGICGTIWLKRQEEEAEESNAQTNTTCECSKDRKAATDRFYKIMVDYESKIEQVQPVYKMFRSWFVFQWVHYIYKLSLDFVYLLRPWLANQSMPYVNLDQFLMRYLLLCVYDILVILSSYLPALKMNAYLRRYVRRQQRQQKKEAKETRSKAQYAYAQAEFKLQTNPRSVFVPRVPGFGINISLQGPGFILTTAILVVGTVATFSKF